MKPATRILPAPAAPLRLMLAVLFFTAACAQAQDAPQPPAIPEGPALPAATDKPARAPRLRDDEHARAEQLILDLQSESKTARIRAEWLLPEFGPAVRPLVAQLEQSHNEYARAAAHRLLALPEMRTDLPRIRIVLKQGFIEAVLFEDAAPNTVAHFIELTEKKFYDGTTFHRVMPEFMVQGGDPTGTGRGGPGYRIEDEINALSLGLDQMTVKQLAKFTSKRPANDNVAAMAVKDLYEKQGYTYRTDLKSYPVLRGCLAMANAKPNEGGSQFFIAQTDCPWLNGKHTVFGKVYRGQSLVDGMKEGSRIKAIEVLHKRDHVYEANKHPEK